MEDQSQYAKRDGIKGMSEMFRIYYDKNKTSFDEMLYLEFLSITSLIKSDYKIAKAFPCNSLGPIIIHKN
jgi:hypothetical protein